MLKKVLKAADNWLIPGDLRQSLYLLRKARILVVVHLFLFFVAGVFALVNTFIIPNVETPPLVWGLLVNLVLLWIFRKWGSLVLSGNLLAGVIFLLFLSSVSETGGIYSDNLLWMMTVPLLALLFANRWSGFFWLLAIQAVAAYFFYKELHANVSYRVYTLQYDGFYYYTTYAGLFLMVTGIVLIFATGQTMIIRALHEKQKELTARQNELAMQTRSLIEAEEKLTITNRELEQFAYAASHDMKEPLRMINSYVQLIRRKIQHDADKSTAEYIEFVTDGVSRMEKLLNDLLEYSRSGRHQENRREVDLNDVLLVVINNLMVGMKEKKAAIYANPLPILLTSHTEMIRLFQNLISNSFKFQRPDKVPVVEIRYQRRNGNHYFEFRDNGIGIAPEHHQRIFNIFDRLHSRFEYEGSGIGLATCKKIINNLGGNIWVQSEEKSGAVFSFTIPVDSLS